MYRSVNFLYLFHTIPFVLNQNLKLISLLVIDRHKFLVCLFHEIKIFKFNTYYALGLHNIYLEKYSIWNFLHVIMESDLRIISFVNTCKT